ncbi:His-Xaa-Ser system radical SAM maturase HxsB [Ensifer adhaerens]|uniref:His-Xaa-Ser system radical SAM maturase HxsB n=1 Tax=Ensifer adhaerens TaxID=106592 RepID=UPI001CBB62AA|nr:His-Xaa-Ser system radical SAM maturase HxsB [Ensifer adhaerens]MBZ7924315.1 His-Xaa-Ser system radical SAM maturase HxsB [Ensifer adhaerens]UAX96434.1 His-Xaa-Ser system radical SAM maturase HxsB [Ensifer adhaerens]UAY04223.1 His-Xaa-Ser system radical SAM maturase HxsB [Ensifer adhaerens]UAY12209.1 His-Xaa-Ser system radical SAM maturase HxsB [Ensifer adhaerens]
MSVVPLKFRPHTDGLLIFADDVGGYFKSDHAFLHRYACGQLTSSDRAFLSTNGHAYDSVGDLSFSGYEHRFAERFYLPRELDYVILVPSLRCNLACGYCQVSRVNENTPGFDWEDVTLEAVINFLDSLTAKKIKVEFQGGEPLLRLDIITKVREFCRQRFEACEIVICTNLQEVSGPAWDLLAGPDIFVSTSLDGDRITHQKQRTVTAPATDQFFANLEFAVGHLGPEKISALPTIDPHNAPSPQEVINTYLSYGIRSIYLRPVNHQGFARKKFDARTSAATWNAYHASFIDALIEHNWSSDVAIEEYYFVHCLRRVLRSGHNGHVDLRNPNIVGHSYVVIDYDGKIYPTDEARMVTRVGQFDLSMGDVFAGISSKTIDSLNAEALNNFHPDCVHCPYQAFCGVDLVDDISRYGRIDLPKHLTDFCQRHMSIFDRIFAMIYSDDPKVQKTLALWSGAPRFDPLLAKVHK